MNLIELQHIDMQFGRKSVLSNFSMEVRKNELLGIVGPSGSGKSTVLNILGLLLQPTYGERIHFGKRNIRINSFQAIRTLREEIGYLFQNYALINTISVQENMEIAAKYSRIPSKRFAIDDALKSLGIYALKKQKVYTLSGGEQQRLAMARLLIKPCQLILADEPTGNLDPLNEKEIISILRNFIAQNKSVVVVTHSQSMLPYFDRIISLQ